MKAKIIACRTLENEILSVKPGHVESEFLEYFLHRTPQRLNLDLQARLNTDQTSQVIMLGYGLCSNGVMNLTSPRHTLVIPRVHDCISLLLGSRELYEREFFSLPGTFYLSKGWIDHGGDPLREYRTYAAQHGEKTARWVIEEQYRHYSRVVFIDTGVGDLDCYREYAREVAAFLKVRYEEITGSTRLLDKMMRGEWDGEFVVTPPGELIRPSSFF